MKFEVFTLDNAPEQSRPFLEKSLAGFGSIPNLHAVLAQSPAVLEAYQQLTGLFQKTSFNKEEITVIWQTINVEHECAYCFPAHTAVAHSMGVEPSVIEALRNKSDLPSEQLTVLQQTILSLVKNRGKVSEAELNEFMQAGYNQQHLLEIILGISHKVISNYVNHIAETPLDDAFKKFL